MFVVPTAVFGGFNPLPQQHIEQIGRGGGGEDEEKERKVRKEPRMRWTIKENLILR